MKTVFDEAPFPDTSKPVIEPLSDGRDARLDNEPPLEERLMLEFVDDLDREGITARVAELLDSAERIPPIDSDAIAGKVGDFCRMASDVQKRIEAAREKHNRPLLTAQRSLKAKAEGVYAGLAAAVAGARTRLNFYMAEQSRQRDEERRIAIEEARKAQEEANARASLPEYAPRIEPAKVEAPVARGDLGARVGTRTVWRHEIEVPIKQLPKALLESAPVREAVDKAIGQMIRAGNREIKGVRIWSEQEASIR